MKLFVPFAIPQVKEVHLDMKHSIKFNAEELQKKWLYLKDSLGFTQAIVWAVRTNRSVRFGFGGATVLVASRGRRLLVYMTARGARVNASTWMTKGNY